MNVVFELGQIELELLEFFAEAVAARTLKLFRNLALDQASLCLARRVLELLFQSRKCRGSAMRHFEFVFLDTF